MATCVPSIVMGLFATALFTNTVSTEHSNSACFGDVSTNATKLYLSCEYGTIKIVNVTVGAKASSSGCPAHFDDADGQNRSCCSPSPGGDCEFELPSKTDYETACNAKASCEPEASNADASGYCTADFNPFSLYMYIQYKCESDEITLSPDESDEITLSPDDSPGFPAWGIALIVVGIVAAGVFVAAIVYYKFWYVRNIKCDVICENVP